MINDFNIGDLVRFGKHKFGIVLDLITETRDNNGVCPVVASVFWLDCDNIQFEMILWLTKVKL